MRFWALAFGLFAFLSLSLPLRAQDRYWLQIEAQPDLATAEARAEAYAAIFDDVQGFLTRDWYVIALGPMSREAAGQRLLSLRDENLIPADSFLADGARYGALFFPAEGSTEPAVSAPEPAAPETVESAEIAPPEETLDEARDAEAALSDEERQALQAALAWFGYYEGAIDGAFGRGTRASFAAWQEARGHEPTGILRSAERAALLAAEAEERALFGFDSVTEEASGIAATLPLGLVEFQGYEPPFVQFAPRQAGGPRLMLISEPGQGASLAGLFDLLKAMSLPPGSAEPAEGFVLEEGSFTIDAATGTTATRAWASVSKGHVKGFVLSWTPDRAKELTRMAEVLRASFDTVGDKVLDPGLVPLEEAVRLGLISGLAPRVPAFSRSGFYVSAEGAVLTLAEDLARCTSITLDGGVGAVVAATDAATGAALLTPARALEPEVVASLATASTRRGAEVVLAGYSYGDRLPAPVLSFGLLEDASGPGGESGILRLRLNALEGDRGGPILNRSGAVIGMLGASRDVSGRILPEGTALSAAASGLSAFLTANGIEVPPAAPLAGSAEALERLALGMTLRVDCWN